MSRSGETGGTDECEHPEITVILPVAKVDSYLRQAVESIKNQTYKNFVCFIVTGHGSALEEIRSVISNDKRFEIVTVNLPGISFAMNYALNLSKTVFVARMDADDVSEPARFEKQANYLKNHEHCVAVGSRVKLIDKKNREIRQPFKFYENDTEIRRALRYRNPLCHPAIMFRREALVEIGGYRYGNSAEDHEMYLRLARNPANKFKNLPDYLLLYRRHESQLTDKRNAAQAFSDISGFLLTEFLRTLDFVFLIGVLANHPYSRKMRAFLRTMSKTK